MSISEIFKPKNIFTLAGLYVCAAGVGASGFLTAAASAATYLSPSPITALEAVAAAVATGLCAYGAYKAGRSHFSLVRRIMSNASAHQNG